MLRRSSGRRFRRAPREPFSFAVLGDWAAVDGTGSNPNQASLMSQLAASGARFALTVGDNVYASGSQTEYGDLVQTGPSISAVFGPQYWANVGASMAIFPAMGNHGMARSDTIHPHLQNWPQDRAVSTSGGRYQIDTYCCINGTTSGNYPSTWYAFDAGIARFYVLEAAWPDGNVGASSAYANDYGYHWTATSAEYQWLRNDLAKHPSQLKFVTFHYPLYSDNVHEASDTYLQGANSLEGLLNQYGVDIIFDGHAHNYQRFRPRNAGGVISYLSGGGGAQLTPINTCSSFDEYAIGWSYASSKGSACHAPLPSTASQVFHYLLVTVNGATVTVTPTNAQGQTFDVKTYSFGQVYRYRTLLPIVASSPGTIVSPFSPAKALDLPTATFGAGSNMPTPAPGLAPTPTLMPPATDTPAPTVTDTPPPTATPSLTWSATSPPTSAHARTSGHIHPHADRRSGAYGHIGGGAHAHTNGDAYGCEHIHNDGHGLTDTHSNAHAYTDGNAHTDRDVCGDACTHAHSIGATARRRWARIGQPCALDEPQPPVGASDYNTRCAAGLLDVAGRLRRQFHHICSNRLSALSQTSLLPSCVAGEARSRRLLSRSRHPPPV